MALLGVRTTGALALVVSCAAFALLLWRTRVPRPLAGALVGAACIAGNLVSGRVTYALGVAFGLLALLALTRPRPAGPAGSAAPAGVASSTPPASPAGPAGSAAPAGPAGPTRPAIRAGSTGSARSVRGWTRDAAVVAAALLASATSPVAGLFLGLVAAALLVTRSVRDGLLLGIAAGLPMLLTTVLFGEGGWMNTGRTDTVQAVVTSVAVALLVPRRPVRVGALLSAAGVLAATLVHTPVGLNATRLVVMFALPVVAAAAEVPAAATRRLPAATGRVVGAAGLVAVLLVGYWWQRPLLTADLHDRGNPTSERAYFEPLLGQLDQRGLTGRVEVPPTRDYWESAYLDGIPLARGWLRQVDIARNPLFFADIPGDGGTGVPLTADSYRAWLTRNAVQWVAVPDAPLSWVGRPEAQLVATGLPYLTRVWSGGHWRLYAVSDPVPLVDAPATLVAQDAAHLTFATPQAGDLTVRVRPSRWLTITGGATITRDGDWIRVHVEHAGRYTIGSSLVG
jgi:hypothetical protein